MDQYRTDKEAAGLMPGHGEGLHVVLFWNPKTDRNHAVLSHFRELKWPETCRQSVLEVSNTPETAAWFGLKETPALAVIREGVLLAVEYACTEDACQRLLNCADRQLRAILADR